MANKIFGENVDMPYDPATARGSVISGISEYMKPQLQKAQGSLQRKGFGRYSVPTIEGQVKNPLLAAGAESVRKATTDLYFKGRQEDRAQEKHPWQMKLMSEQYKTSRGARHGGKVLCTELYRQGLLPLSHIKADLRYLKKFVDKEMHENYLRWSIPLVDIMRKSKLVTYSVYPFILCWSEYMKCRVYEKRMGFKAILGLIFNNTMVRYGKFYKKIKEVRGVESWAS